MHVIKNKLYNDVLGKIAIYWVINGKWVNWIGGWTVSKLCTSLIKLDKSVISAIKYGLNIFYTFYSSKMMYFNFIKLWNFYACVNTKDLLNKETII